MGDGSDGSCVRVGDAAEKDQGVGVEDARRDVVRLSDARIDDRIDVTSQLDRISLWEPSPASLQLVERHGRALQGHETGNRLATTRDAAVDGAYQPVRHTRDHPEPSTMTSARSRTGSRAK